MNSITFCNISSYYLNRGKCQLHQDPTYSQFQAVVCGTGTGESYAGAVENYRHIKCADYSALVWKTNNHRI